MRIRGQQHRIESMQEIIYSYTLGPISRGAQPVDGAPEGSGQHYKWRPGGHQQRTEPAEWEGEAATTWKWSCQSQVIQIWIDSGYAPRYIIGHLSEMGRGWVVKKVKKIEDEVTVGKVKLNNHGFLDYNRVFFLNM